jgi:nucleotide-binding universal stress UspA family protein
MITLCGTDFSEQAERAATAAAQIARRFGDTVVLAHVLEQPTTNLLEIRGEARRLEHLLREAADRALHEAAARLQRSGATVETALLSGEPEQALTAQARQLDARMLVVGTHGRRALWRWFVGSVAERVQRLSDRSVLVVREAAQGIADWSAGRRPLRILVAVDLDGTIEAVVHEVRLWRQAGPCDVTFAHAARPFDYPAHVSDVIERELSAKIADLPGTGRSRLLIIPNLCSTGDALAQLAQQESSDLIVTGTHHRRGIDLVTAGSVSREVLRAATMPVLTAPAAAATGSRAEIPRLHTILAATDLSEAANRVVRYAYALVPPGGRVVLCHILRQTEPAVHEAAERELRALVPEAARARGIATEISIRPADDVPRAIADIAERLDADAVVMGCRERSQIAHALTGSIADGVLRPGLPLFVVRTRTT